MEELRREWGDNIKMGVTEGLWGVLDRIRLTEGGEKWRAVVSTVMNLRVL